MDFKLSWLESKAQTVEIIILQITSVFFPSKIPDFLNHFRNIPIHTYLYTQLNSQRTGLVH